MSGIVNAVGAPDLAYVSLSGYGAHTPGHPGHVFAVNAATSPAGVTDISAGLPDAPVTALAVDRDSGDLYAGTDFGVWRRPAAGGPWALAALGLPRVAVFWARVPRRVEDARGRHARPWRLHPEAPLIAEARLDDRHDLPLRHGGDEPSARRRRRPACLEAGGNAADAAVCAAAVLCVVEPMSTGIGGDAFALVWQHGAADRTERQRPRAGHGRPGGARRRDAVHGPQSVTVPGAVAGWQALLERHGTWGLDRCLADAIDAAENGFQVTPVIADVWNRTAADLAAYDEAARVFLPAPAVGTTWRKPRAGRHAARHRRRGPDAFYRGPVAAAIASATWLEESDLAGMRADWVEPLRHALRRRDRVRAAAQRPGRGGPAGDGDRARLRPRRARRRATGCTCRPRR